MLDRRRILSPAPGGSLGTGTAATTTHAGEAGGDARHTAASPAPFERAGQSSGRDLGLAGTRLPAGHFFRGFCWGLLFEVLGALLILLAVFALLFVGPWLLGELVR